MRKIVKLLVVLLVLWCAWWVVGQQAIARGLDAWLDMRRAEGWQAEANVETYGFPARWRSTFTSVAIADPETGIAWSAPRFSLVANAWSPTRVTADWPSEQTFSTPLENIDISSERMTGHLGLVPGLDFTLDASAIDLSQVALDSSRGWNAALDHGVLTTDRLDTEPLTHDIHFEADGLRPAAALKRAIDRSGLLPDTIGEMALDARVSFDAPWDRYAIEQRRPQITALDLSKLTATWGDMALEAAGNITVDPDGVPDGRITVRATNWRDMIEVGRASGFIPDSIAPTVENALEALARLSGNERTLDLPLSFQNARMSIGPIPLGRAPRIVIR